MIAWDGERTVTFSMEDAVLSPESFAILAGADLNAASETKPEFVHTTSQVQVEEDGLIVLDFASIEDAKDIVWNGGRKGSKNNITVTATDDDVDNHYEFEADIYCMTVDSDSGEVNAEPCVPAKMKVEDGRVVIACEAAVANGVVLVDYYVKKTKNVLTAVIGPETFGANFYVEGDTLFRQEGTGKDFPAEIVIPDAKVQSNFNLAMAPNGDPSTFSFTMDAFPAYTKFDKTTKVFADIQMILPEDASEDLNRENCEANPVNFNEAVTLKAGVTASNVKNTETTCTMTVSGTDVASDYSADLFGTDSSIIGTEATIVAASSAGTYTVKQTNPGLEYFSADSYVSDATGEWVKTKDYTISDGETLDYSFLITDKGGPIVIEVSNVDGVIKTYTIEVNVTFA